MQGADVSKYFWTSGAILFALFFAWRFIATGAPHDLASATGFALVCPYLWMRPVNLFRPLRSELSSVASTPPPPIGVTIASFIGFLLVLIGAAWRWLAA
jgi:hypothetical protein